MMLKDRYILLAHKRFSGQISEDERRELDTWIQSDPVNGVMIEQLLSVWNNSLSYKPEVRPDINKAKAVFFSHIDKEEENTRPVLHFKPEVRIRRIYQWSAVAAGILIVFGFYFILSKNSNDLPVFMEGSELTAAFKDNQNIEFLSLPDGTKVWLKPGTRISIAKRFNQEDREIYLDGEIFTEVSPDRAKPFRIIMERGRVEVLGTSFYLNSGKKGHGHLKLLEGKVLFNLTSSKITLENQGEILWDNARDSIIVPDSLHQLSSDWVKDYLIFENATLQQVFDKLSRHYDVSFRIECPGIEKMKGFTSFIHQQDNPKLSSYLEAVKKVYNLEISKNADNIYYVTGEPCF